MAHCRAPFSNSAYGFLRNGCPRGALCVIHFLAVDIILPHALRNERCSVRSSELRMSRAQNPASSLAFTMNDNGRAGGGGLEEIGFECPKYRCGLAMSYTEHCQSIIKTCPRSPERACGAECRLGREGREMLCFFHRSLQVCG